jgi:hypothetical protein
VLRHLAKVLLLNSLSLGPLLVKRSADLGKGLLKDPRNEGLFPLGELPFLGEELIDYHTHRRHCRARR